MPTSFNYYQSPMRDLRPDPDAVPPYEVLLLESDPNQGEEHQHIIAIQTRDPDGGQTRWAAVQVISALQTGEQFVVDEGDGQKRSVLEPAVCPACEKLTISVGPGGAEAERRT